MLAPVVGVRPYTSLQSETDIGMSAAFNFLITLLFPLFLFAKAARDRCANRACPVPPRPWLWLIDFQRYFFFRSFLHHFNLLCRVSSFVAVGDDGDGKASRGISHRPLYDEQIENHFNTHTASLSVRTVSATHMFRSVQVSRRRRQGKINRIH